MTDLRHPVALEVLRFTFGYDAFREGQAEPERSGQVLLAEIARQ